MRGDIFRWKAPRDVRGHEQRGPRFAVVVQSDELPLSTLLVALTSTRARASYIRPEIDLEGQRTLVMTDQTMAVAPERLGDFAGRLSAAEMAEVDRALLAVFGLD